MAILVLNTGSSTLKFALFPPGAAEASLSGLCDWKTRRARLEGGSRGREDVPLPTTSRGPTDAIAWLLERLEAEGARAGVRAVGHRVVHGGAAFQSSVRIDADVKQTLKELCELAPLHNPAALAGIEAAEAALPGLPQVAVFDTAFFANLSPAAFLYPLPYEWYTDWGIRRFGFHGTSHAYCARRAAEILDRNDLRLITCHLGNGCSASAIRGGKAVITTMGFTPLEGLMMGTRSGSIDPGILFYVMRDKGLAAEQLDPTLNQRSGLLGVSGVSSDYREVEKAADAGNERARLALEMFALRVRQTIGALAATLGGVDALVFTAGIGEHAARLRAAVCNGLECLGIQLDPARNQTAKPDADVATDDSVARILILHTREELMIARETEEIVFGV